MLTQEDLQAVGILVKALLKPLTEKIETLDQKVETLDQKIEAYHALNQKEHAEIMEKLVDSNEINGQIVKTLEKRVDRLEEHTGLAKPA